MPYPARQRKQPEKFQVFQAGDSHVPVSLRVEKARSRKKDRERKTMKDGTEDKAKVEVNNKDNNKKQVKIKIKFSQKNKQSGKAGNRGLGDNK